MCTRSLAREFLGDQRAQETLELAILAGLVVAIVVVAVVGVGLWASQQVHGLGVTMGHLRGG